MTITIYVAEKPSAKEVCSIFTVESPEEAKTHLWALAKQAKPEWAMFWMPLGIEPITNDGWGNLEVPSVIAGAVATEVARQNKMVMETIVTEGLNTVYEELAALFYANPNFVELLTNAASDWAKDCYQHAENG